MYWEASFPVLTAASVMFDVVDLGVMSRCRDLIARCVRMYGPDRWALIYPAEVRARCEHVVVIRLKIAAKVSSGEYRADQYPTDRPWNAAWNALIDDSVLWRWELEEPAYAVLTKIPGGARCSRRRRCADPACTCQGPSWVACSPAAGEASHGFDSEGPGPTFPGNHTRRCGWQVHQCRNSERLCASFNGGGCGPAINEHVYPSNPNEAHQCHCRHDSWMREDAQQATTGVDRGAPVRAFR